MLSHILPEIWTHNIFPLLEGTFTISHEYIDASDQQIYMLPIHNSLQIKTIRTLAPYRRVSQSFFQLISEYIQQNPDIIHSRLSPPMIFMNQLYVKTFIESLLAQKRARWVHDKPTHHLLQIRNKLYLISANVFLQIHHFSFPFRVHQACSINGCSNPFFIYELLSMHPYPDRIFFLRLSNNRLFHFNFHHFETLIDLDLSKNQLKTFPHLRYFPLLEQLNLSHNQLEYVHLHGYNLQTLDLSHNSIRSINPFVDFLRTHHSLLRLELSGNQIENIDSLKRDRFFVSAFQQNHSLLYLHLGDNRIRHLPPIYHTRLRVLLLDNETSEGNVIETIPKNFFYGLPSLRYFGIQRTTLSKKAQKKLIEEFWKADNISTLRLGEDQDHFEVLEKARRSIDSFLEE